jgi:uncharacterized protein YjdB
MTVLLLLGFVACGQDALPTSPAGPEQNQLVAVVDVQPSDAVVAPDETVHLSAIVRGARGQTVNGRPVSWSSSDESVAYVDDSGNVVAGREGSATITANVLGVKGTGTIDVRGDVVQIVVDDPVASIEEGSVQTLSARYVYSNGAMRPATYVKWTTSDPSVLFVDGQGEATATGAGDVQVTAQGRGRGSDKNFKVKGGKATSVTVQAGSTQLVVGEEVDLWAIARDSQGRRLYKTFNWTSSQPSVAIVNQSGTVTALSAGQTTITAEVDEVSGSVNMSVTGSSGGGGNPTPAPQPVTDLSVTSTQENSVTLRFTQVDDGTGAPASYQVRYIPSSVSFSWGQALDVTSGTCQAPLTGGAIGATLTCTVTALQAASSYAFQLVSFRGSLESTPVFGPLSNRVTGVTADPAVIVAVTPSAFSLDVGLKRTLTAKVTDSYGNPLEQAVTWTSSRTSVATVASPGSVTAVSAGTATINARASGGSSDGASATIINPSTSGGGGTGGGESARRESARSNPGESAGSAPAAPGRGGLARAGLNQPAEFELINSQPWNMLPAMGTVQPGPATNWWQANNPGKLTLINDPDAPASPPSVLQARHPAGQGHGAGIWNAWTEFSLYGKDIYRKLYFSAWFKMESG